MSLLRRVAHVPILLILLLAACATEETPLPSPTLTPRPRRTALPTQPPPPTPTVEIISTTPPQVLVSPLASPLQTRPDGIAQVLFVQGDFLPDSGYPHSRVKDDGTQPESFTHLRADVLERDLGLSVDEIILDGKTPLSLSQISSYAIVVLGSNAHPFDNEEISALMNYYLGGGSILVYADFQYGPQNWASDNGLLRQFGIAVLSDNFQPTTLITNIIATHPIMRGVGALQVEGISQFVVPETLTGIKELNPILATCSPINRAGCIVPPSDSARLKATDSVACVIAIEHANGGRLAGVCDRNLFQNGPGPGSDLDQADNRTFARNLYAWLAHRN